MMAAPWLRLDKNTLSSCSGAQGGWCLTRQSLTESYSAHYIAAITSSNRIRIHYDNAGSPVISRHKLPGNSLFCGMVFGLRRGRKRFERQRVGVDLVSTKGNGWFDLFPFPLNPPLTPPLLPAGGILAMLPILLRSKWIVFHKVHISRVQS